MTFQEFGFDERIQRAIDEAGFNAPMPVQAECFQLLIREHRDVYAQSQTGTGKTAAFLLSIFQLLLTDEKYQGQKALVIVPTRELAVQIEAEGKLLGRYLDFRIGSVFGGVGYGQQEKMLEGGVDILIGTPGRLIDFSKQRKINLIDFGFLVIDEADRLFDMGFLPDLRRILKGLKPHTERHTLLFSATLNARVGNLAWEYMNNPGEIIIEPEKKTVDTVSQELYHVGKDEKLKLLLGLLKRDNPENAVIFTNTRHSAWEVAKRLEVNGYSVVFLMGDQPQSQRLRIVDEVKKGHHKFLVATDVAARGLHIDELEMVINYDVPLEPESYIHRIGRTARVGKEGKTITLACEEFVYGLGQIEKLLGRKIPVSWADDSLVVEDKSAGMRFPPQDRYRDLGISRSDRQGRPDSRSREGSRRSPDGRGGRKESDHGRPAPRSGKKPLDPRAAKIQSSISSITSGELDVMTPATEPRSDERRADVRSDRSRSGKKRSNRAPAPEKKEKSGPPETGKRSSAVPAGQDRLSPGADIDERLAYYRKKYGEDFRISGTGTDSSRSKGTSPDGKSRSGRKGASKKRNTGKVPAISGSGASDAATPRARDQRRSAADPAAREPRETGGRDVRAGNRDQASKTPAASPVQDNPQDKTRRKGIFGRLFGR